MKSKACLLLATILLLLATVNSVRAWDYEGHRVVNQLALAALPTNFPAFVLTPEARERIAFLAGEPDRWRNMGGELPMAHCSFPDHYFDLDELDDYGIKIENLPIFRYELAGQLALARAAHPDRFAPIDPNKNRDHTRELIGFLPWSIVEAQAKLKSAFSYLRAFQEYGGTPAEIANAQANILYLMGTMGHYVGDGAQPLHATKHHHGWVGPNPNGYSTNSSFHGWIDGGYLQKSGGLKAESLTGKIRPAKIVGDPFDPENLFRAMIAYLEESHQKLEPLYQLNKDGKLSPDREGGLAGRPFLEEQIVRGGQMLGDLWYSAWQQAAEDRYLIRSLNDRKKTSEAPK